MENQKALLAGGCFWGMEDLIRKLPGVVNTEVGYTGGQNEDPTYQNHTGHAEALMINFDPSQITFKDILDNFFQLHDPTTMNQQGNDRGDSYRSAIFYLNEEQKADAQEVIKLVNESGRWENPVVTEVTAASKFYPAEDYHQDYLVNNPGGYTCHFVRPGGSYLK